MESPLLSKQSIYIKSILLIICHLYITIYQINYGKKHFFKTLLISAVLLVATKGYSTDKASKESPAELWAKEKVQAMTIEEKVDFLCGASCALNDQLKGSASTKEISRLGIKPMVVSDGPAGCLVLK